MSMGIIEGLITTLGEELTEAAGIQSTRTTTALTIETVVQRGINNMSGTVGTAAAAVPAACTWAGSTTVLCTDTTGVTAGQWIRLDSDGQVFEVSFVVVNTSFTILNPAGLTIPTGVGPSSFFVPTVLTLGSGLFLADVVPGMRFRLTSGVLVGDEALINSRDSGTQVTLRHALHAPPTVFVASSWEITTPADTTFPVENTAGWPATGEFYIEGVRYRYTGKTATSFTGVSWFNEEFWVSGAKEAHGTYSTVVDFSKNSSALDEYRRSFLVDYASGADLDVVGRNIGTLRPVTITSDDTYRKLIKAIGYTARGTVYAQELALEALLGETLVQSSGPEFLATASGRVVTLVGGTFDATIANGNRFRIKTEGTQFDETVLIDERLSGTQIRLQTDRLGDFSRQQWEVTSKNWLLFEDLTVGSLNHAARVYMTNVDDSSNTVSVGKTYIDGPEKKLATSTTEVPIDNPHIRVGSIRWAPEGGPYLIDEGTAASSVDSGVTITGPASQFSTRIQPGDLFELRQRGPANITARVKSRDSDTQLTLGHLSGIPMGHFDTTGIGGLGSDFSAATWKVWREKTNCRYYRPSAESIIAYTGDAGTTMWTWIGGVSELTESVPGYVLNRGQVLKLSPPPGGEAAYVHTLRIEPESVATFEVNMDHDDNLDVAGNGLQMCFGFSDGERTIIVGVVDDGAGAQDLGFIDTTGAFVAGGAQATWSGTAATTYTPGFNTLRIKKNGRGEVELWRQASNVNTPLNLELVDSYAYASFPAVATWTGGAAPYAAGTKEFFFGALQGGGHELYVKHADYKVEPYKEHWNTSFTDCSISGTTLTDDLAGNVFVPADVGRCVNITDFGAQLAEGGNSLGLWEIATVPGGGPYDAVTLQGRTQGQGHFSQVNRSRFYVRDNPYAFTWPNDLGRSIEILTGPHAGGIYKITTILDPATSASDINVETVIPATAGHSRHATTQWDTAAKIQRKIYSNIALCDTAGGAPALTSGFTVEQDEVQWRFVGNFVADTEVVCDLIDSGEDLLSIPTTRTATMAVSDLMEITRSRVLTGQIHDHLTRNDTTPAPYANYPFYLYDSFGGSRSIFSDLLAAAILPRFDEIFVDASGVHILE